MSEPSRGLCVKHLWGAPPGKDSLPCPYCLGIMRSSLGPSSTSAEERS
jgi:hypothetical protein